MKSLCLYSIIAGLALLAGCQKNLGWTRLDDSSPKAERLEQARKACRIDIKLTGLERAKDERKINLKKASTDKAKMLVKDEYEQIKNQVYQEIDTCMNKKGYQR